MKRIVLILSAIIVMSSTVACSSIVGEEKLIPDENSRIITDCVGREVIIPKDIQRVAALYAATGHITVMLGHGEKIVATSNGILRDKLLHEICPEVKNASAVKVSSDFNIEELIALNVDVVFIPKEMYLNDKNTKMLKKANLPFLVVDFNSIEEHKYLVKMLGEVFYEQEEAQDYCDFYDEVITQTNKNLKNLNQKNKAKVYHSLNEAVNTVAKDTLPSEWMQIAGGVNVSLNSKLNADGDKYYTTLEEILKWNPPIILCNVDTTHEYILSEKAWENLDAVKNQHVYQMPVGISRWGHTTSLETPLAIAWTAKTLYPQYNENVNVRELTKAFYLDLFEIELSNEQIDAIMSGKGMRLSKSLE